MKLKIKKHNNSSMQARWMVSFADLLSVVLVFMVLIYSTGKNLKETNKFTLNEKSYFSVRTSDEQSKIELDTNDNKLSAEYLKNVFASKFKHDSLLRNIPIKQENEKLVMNFTESFFASPEATKKLVDTLSGIKNGVMVYARNLDSSNLVAEKLRNAGLDNRLSFFESASASNGIDIIIYP